MDSMDLPELYEHGLAYKAEIPINWCTSCKIGLANEEVVGGAVSAAEEVVRKIRASGCSRSPSTPSGYWTTWIRSTIWKDQGAAGELDRPFGRSRGRLRRGRDGKENKGIHYQARHAFGATTWCFHRNIISSMRNAGE